MARERRAEAPMTEEPKQDSPFDLSDMGTAPETPKAKRKRSEAKAEPLRIAGSGTETHLPGVHERKPRKRGGKVVSSEGKLNASAEGTIESSRTLPASEPRKSEVEEALEMVRETAEESEWDAKIAEAKAKIADEELRQKLPAIPAYKDKRVAAPPEGAEVPEYEEMTVEGAPKAYTTAEEAWFKKGEDPAHLKAVAERQEIEDLRKGIASYDESAKEVIIDTQEEIDAAVKRVEGMLKSGELHPDMFDIRDYEYLLTEQARIDRELESAGWWAARKLRRELNDARKNLADYERQIESVERERADARDKARGLPSIPARKVQTREGSGTSVHTDKKPGFFARLFGKK